MDWIIEIGIIVIIVIIFLMIYSNVEEKSRMQEYEEHRKKLRQEQKKRKKSLDKKYGTCTRQLCRDENRNYTIRVYESSKVIVIDDKAYHFDDIIGCEPMPQTKIERPPATTTVTDASDMAIRAAIGNMVLGPAGAIVGALTAKKKTVIDSDAQQGRVFEEMIHDSLYRTGGVIMYLKSIKTPQVLIPCYKKEEQEVCAVIHAITATSEQ